LARIASSKKLVAHFMSHVLQQQQSIFNFDWQGLTAASALFPNETKDLTRLLLDSSLGLYGLKVLK
jgi:hypothetical protein